MADRRKKPKTGQETTVDDGDERKESPVVSLEAPRKTEKRTKKAATTRQRNMNGCVEEWMKWTKAMGVAGLGQLFRSKLQMACVPTKPAPSFERNMEKNRYKDVICLEETRVTLEKDGPNDGDYIHANYVRFPFHDRIYICAQGPMEKTGEDFWRMVWQEKSPIIVNLTTCYERKDDKEEIRAPRGSCWQYWPLVEQEPMQCGRFSVLVKRVDREGHLTIYVVELLPEGCSNSHILRIIHENSWPDGGVLRARSILRLIKRIYLADTLACKEPVIIHCGAGVGRTGAMVLIDYMLYRLLFVGKATKLEEAFLLLRQQRASSIQSEVQFVYVAVTVVRYIALASKIPAHLAWADDFKEQFKNAYPNPEMDKKTDHNQL